MRDPGPPPPPVRSNPGANAAASLWAYMGLWACAALHEGGRFVPVASLGLRYCYTMYAYPLLMATTCFSCIAGWQSFLFVHKWCETTIAPAPCKGGSQHPILWMFHLLLDRGPALTAKQKPASDPDPVEPEPLRVPLQQHPQPQAGRTRDVPTGHYFHTASPKQRAAGRMWRRIRDKGSGMSASMRSGTRIIPRPVG